MDPFYVSYQLCSHFFQDIFVIPAATAQQTMGTLSHVSMHIYMYIHAHTDKEKLRGITVDSDA